MEQPIFLLGSRSNIGRGWTLAVLAEAFQTDEMWKFDLRVDHFLWELQKIPPFNDAALRPALNVLKIRVPSVQSGEVITVIPADETTESPFNTAFGALFHRQWKGRPTTRTVWGNGERVRAYLRSVGLPTVDAALVIVNGSIVAGTRYDHVAWLSTATKQPRAGEPPEVWGEIAVHEMAHVGFGLVDEYQYKTGPLEPVTIWSGNEPNAPNVTKVTDVSSMKWGHLVTVDPALVPTTVVTSGCDPIHPVLMTDPPIPANAVGAFEGAYQHTCGVFRPSRQCMMELGGPFCRVCEQRARAGIGHNLVSHGKTVLLFAGPWTHVQTFDGGRRTLSYDALTGSYSISRAADYASAPRRPDGTPPLGPNPATGTGALGPGWSWLVPFSWSGRQHYFAHQFGSGTQAMFAATAAQDAIARTWISPPGITWTHVVSLALGGKPHVVLYDTLTGDAALYRIDAPTVPPVLLASMRWPSHEISLASFSLAGEPYVLAYSAVRGGVEIRRVVPTGWVEAWSSPRGFWRSFASQVSAIELFGRTYILRYSLADATASLWHVRSGGAGIDFVCPLQPRPGFDTQKDVDPLSVLGLATQSMGVFHPESAGSPRRIFFYLRAHQSLEVGWTLPTE